MQLPYNKIVRTMYGYTRIDASEVKEGDHVYTLTGVMKRIETLVKPDIVVGMTYEGLQANRLQAIPTVNTILHMYTDRGVTRCVIEECWVDPQSMETRKTVIVQTVNVVKSRLKPVATGYTLQEVPL